MSGWEFVLREKILCCLLKEQKEQMEYLSLLLEALCNQMQFWALVSIVTLTKYLK